MTYYDDIINRTKRNYTKILYGTGSLKSVDKVYNSYRIPPSEKIIATLKTGISLFGFDGVVITNQAIYFSQHKDDRIPYDEICEYIVYMKDEKDNAMIATANTHRSITPPSLFSKNISGIELCSYVKDIQRELMNDFSWAKEQRTVLVNEICSKTEEVKLGDFPEYLLNVLNELRYEEYSCNNSVIAESELYFLRNGEEGYISFVNSLPNNVSNEVKVKLLNSVTELKEKMIDNLSNTNIVITDKYLGAFLYSVGTWKNTDKLTALAKCYLYIRYKDMLRFNEEMENSKNFLSQEEIANLKVFKGCYFNHLMINVYNTIKNGDIPTDEMCKWHDSFGLTALHYALILRKNDVAEKLLKAQKWNCYDLFDNESGINRFLDYKFLAKLLNMPCVNDIITSTTDIIEAQLKTIKSYKIQIKLKEGLAFLNNQAISNLNAQKRAVRAQGDYDKYNEIEEEIYRIKDIIKQRHEEIRELNNDIEEIYTEIQNIISEYNSNLDSKISTLKQSKNKFIVFLLSLFENPDFLLRAISAETENSQNYSYLGFEFTTFSNLDIDLDKEIDDDTLCNESDDAEGDISPLYGNSWFSPDAHKDIKILSAEYRKLAKKYHPDICKNNNANKVFVDITNERAEIVERIK